MRRTAAAALSCALLVPLAACGGGGSEEITVVASVYPLEYVAQRIAGDRVEVVDLVQPGSEPHDAELSPRQTAQVADADLVLRVAGLAPAVDDAVAQEVEPEADAEAIRVLQEREPALSDGRPVRVLDGDPHFWLDPHALATYAAEVEERLVALDPDHAADYRQNARALRTDLGDLDDRMRSGLTDCARRTVVVSHEAYDYLGYRYDLDFSSLVGMTPEDEPSPATLAAVQDLVQTDGVTTVFYEPLEGPAPVETLAADLGLAVAALDPIEGLTDETAEADYLSLMRANLDGLVSAGECTGAAGS
ncbi:MAG: Zinc ABC transporter, substrate-binding protein ZnuA [uncultured Nocardioidaceae bacterium]|uniref:Zinc ABC transporter, substrate-binding protein ZnuA n=1 Tax=uncultured Nocardioidaceae bacterium TaxID=253824 RepID=A0A6J4LF71_9ACTN|nr:MAG: Zinc ABC transporter, substrate-binding protein ZnuA [uncultured Nocardioidaceae bacterium]